jgi:outer membrane protein assembly factor BamE (lipoprotein component of BamABCDE complex)
MAYSLGRVAALGAVLALAGLGMAGCHATVNQRGYLPDPGLAQKIRVGVDTKDSLQASIGSPSTVSTFNDSTWYYISTTQEDFLFLRPEETDRQVVAVAFGPDRKVTSVKQLGPQDGVDVAFSDDETPTRGRELTFLQQIFGNVGRGSPLGTINDEDPRERR